MRLYLPSTLRFHPSTKIRTVAKMHLISFVIRTNEQTNSLLLFPPPQAFPQLLFACLTPF